MLALLLAAAPAGTAAPAPAPPATAFAEVVAAERSFAADSPAKGLHEAFLAHLADDSVVFQPLPTPGIAAHQGKPRAPGVLSWAPAWVAAASSGLAFSTGPWEYRPNDPAETPRTGWFFSVWAKQPSGDWKVKADFGVGCPLTYAKPPDVIDGNPPETAPAPLTPKDLARARARLNADESRLDRAGESGIGAAVLAHADPGLRAYREGTCPASGLEAARAVLEKDVRKLACKPQRIELAPAGDLGFAYGTCETREGDPEKTGFLRTWRRGEDGAFRVLADIVAEVPGRK